MELPQPLATARVGCAWLHLPTGIAGLNEFTADSYGGPDVKPNKATRLLEALTPVPQPRGLPDNAGRTEAEVEAALAERGLIPVSRAQAAAYFRLDGYRLGVNYAIPQDLYAYEVDDTLWSDSRATRHDRELYVISADKADPAPELVCAQDLSAHPGPVGCFLAWLNLRTGAAGICQIARDARRAPVVGALAPILGRAVGRSEADVEAALAERGLAPITRARAAARMRATRFALIEADPVALLAPGDADGLTWYGIAGTAAARFVYVAHLDGI